MNAQRSSLIAFVAIGVTWAISLPAVADDNDESCDAILIEGNSSTDYNTAGATESPEPFSPWQCQDTYFTGTGPDLWFKLQLDNPGQLLLSTCRAGGHDTDLSLYSGSCSLLTQVACNGDSPVGGNCQPYYSLIDYEVTTPGEYFVRVGGYNGAYGEGRLTSTWDPVLDCDGDGVPDEDEPDCDGDDLPDDCELDCNENGIPDDCESLPDCNGNSIPDECDISGGLSSDFNLNQIPDECESTVIEVPFILTGIGGACLPEGPIELDLPGTLLGVHVEFEFFNQGDLTWPSDLLICLEDDDEDDNCLQIGGYDLICSNECDNEIELPKSWEVTDSGFYETYLPVWGIGLPEIGESTVAICHGYDDGSEPTTWNGTLRFACLPGKILDCNANGISDEEDINSGVSEDCNENAIPDECDINEATSPDIDHNSVPDECQDALGDDCALAVQIEPTSVTFFSTFNATHSGHATDDDLCPDTFFTDCEPDIWFYFELPQDGTLFLHTCHPESFDTDLALLSGNDCSDITQIACNGDGIIWNPCQDFYSRIYMDVPRGNYFIRLGGYEDAVGSGTLTSIFTPDAPACIADLNGDKLVNGADMGLLIASWGPCVGCNTDLTGDGIVDGADVGLFLAWWGPCP